MTQPFWVLWTPLRSRKPWTFYFKHHFRELWTPLIWPSLSNQITAVGKGVSYPFSHENCLPAPNNVLLDEKKSSLNAPNWNGLATRTHSTAPSPRAGTLAQYWHVSENSELLSQEYGKCSSWPVLTKLLSAKDLQGIYSPKRFNWTNETRTNCVSRPQGPQTSGMHQTNKIPMGPMDILHLGISEDTGFWWVTKYCLLERNGKSAKPKGRETCNGNEQYGGLV